MVERERLPGNRHAVTHSVTFQWDPYDRGERREVELSFTVGLYPDGRPGELFIKIDREGSALGGAYDALGIAVSLLFQNGLTIDELERKFAHTRSTPDGFTPDMGFAKSITDYIFRWIKAKLPEKVKEKGLVSTRECDLYVEDVEGMEVTDEAQ